MIKFVCNRFLLSIPTLLAVLTIVFLIARVIPGDPAAVILGDSASQEALENLRHRLGLDQSLMQQYIQFITGVFRGNLGDSLVSGTSVMREVLNVLPYTIDLTLAGVFIGIIIGVPVGILTALYSREKTGKGQLVEIAMVETVYPSMASNLADVFNNKAPAPRTGNRHGGLAEAPYNVYPASDGYVAIISVNESHWAALTRAMGRPELLDDPRFKSVLDRLEHIDLTDQIVGEWSSGLTRSEVVETCRQHKVPCAAVRDLLEVTQDRHLHARGMLRDIRHPEYGDILVHRSPLVLHGATTPDYAPSARLGEHNGEILSQYLGMSTDEIGALRRSGAIAQG